MVRSSFKALQFLCGLTLGAYAVGCSAGDNGGGSPLPTGQGGSAANGGSAGSGAGGSGGLIGQGGSGQGGSGQGGIIGQGGNGQGGSGQGGDTCESVGETAENTLLPVDILFAVDTSGSMGPETLIVQNALNAFANGIETIPNLDYRVVMMAEANDGSFGADGVCVPAPLGSGQCPGDSNFPKYSHLPTTVGSSNALQLIVQNFDLIAGQFRTNSTKHVIVITDDNSSMSAYDFNMEFSTKLAAAGMPTDYVFHAVYSTVEQFGCTADVGTVYGELVNSTGGEFGNLCQGQNAFVSTFTAVGQQVISGVSLACEWVIPAPPAGETLNPDQVNVEFTPPGGSTESFGRVDNAAACSTVNDGWYFDDPTNPTQILACPQTCTRLQEAGDQATMEILFGCKTEIAPPK